MSKRILIADGDPCFSCRLADVLRLDGYDVRVASNGLECRSDIRYETPDMLIINAELPWGTGLGVLASLREEEPELTIPVILIRDRTEIPLDSCPVGPVFLTFTKPVPELSVSSILGRVFESGEVAR